MMSLRSSDLVLAALMLLTAASYASWAEAALNPGWSGSVVIIVAFIKVRLIGTHFMEIGQSALPLRLAFDAWLVGTAAILLLLFGLPA